MPDTVDVVRRILQRLKEAALAGDNERCLRLLSSLTTFHFNTELLQQTKAGLVVSKLRHIDEINATVKKTAKALVKVWRSIVDEENAPDATAANSTTDSRKRTASQAAADLPGAKQRRLREVALPKITEPSPGSRRLITGQVDKDLESMSERERSELAAVTRRQIRGSAPAQKRVLTSVPSLHSICLEVIGQNLDLLGDVGDVPYEILEPALRHCSVAQLRRIEHFNPGFKEFTDSHWEEFCRLENIPVPKSKPKPNYREIYQKFKMGKEDRFNKLAAKMSHRKVEQSRKTKALVLKTGVHGMTRK
eukprot:m.142124 g.142124  ORF g.142124 m.142124 type:complete len:306 (+) comp10035_c0_seq1:76-993(+)